MSGGGRLDPMKMKNTLVLCITILGLLSSAGPVLAHHSTAM